MIPELTVRMVHRKDVKVADRLTFLGRLIVRLLREHPDGLFPVEEVLGWKACFQDEDLRDLFDERVRGYFAVLDEAEIHYCPHLFNLEDGLDGAA